MYYTIQSSSSQNNNIDWEAIKEFIPKGAIADILLILILSFFLFSSKLVKKKLKNWDKQFFKALEQDEDLERESLKLLTASGADRVVIGEFSNGERSFSGTPFMKIRFRKESKLPALRSIYQITGKTIIDLTTIQQEIKTLFKHNEIVIYDRNQEGLDKGCTFHLYRINSQAFFEEILYYEDQPIGIVAFYFGKPLTQKDYEKIKNSSLIFYCKEEIVKILNPKPNWFRRIFNFVI